jgi:hypothetical protein
MEIALRGNNLEDQKHPWMMTKITSNSMLAIWLQMGSKTELHVKTFKHNGKKSH